MSTPLHASPTPSSPSFPTLGIDEAFPVFSPLPHLGYPMLCDKPHRGPKGSPTCPSLWSLCRELCAPKVQHGNFQTFLRLRPQMSPAPFPQPPRCDPRSPAGGAWGTPLPPPWPHTPWVLSLALTRELWPSSLNQCGEISPLAHTRTSTADCKPGQRTTWTGAWEPLEGSITNTLHPQDVPVTHHRLGCSARLFLDTESGLIVRNSQLAQNKGHRPTVLKLTQLFGKEMPHPRNVFAQMPAHTGLLDLGLTGIQGHCRVSPHLQGTHAGRQWGRWGSFLGDTSHLLGPSSNSTGPGEMPVGADSAQGCSTFAAPAWA